MEDGGASPEPKEKGSSSPKTAKAGSTTPPTPKSKVPPRLQRRDSVVKVGPFSFFPRYFLVLHFSAFFSRSLEAILTKSVVSARDSALKHTVRQDEGVVCGV